MCVHKVDLYNDTVDGRYNGAYETQVFHLRIVQGTNVEIQGEVVLVSSMSPDCFKRYQFFHFSISATL